MIGIDIIEISRFEKMENFDGCLTKYFCQSEIAYINGKGAGKFAAAAGIFCAKEAAAKALGTGFAGFLPKDIEISHTENGAPYSVFRGIRFEISISHCREYATAVALTTNDK